ncbi:MAG: glycosyltransferase family 2 protein [Myxococcales bacterium]|nr:glycosyltransferase family 2 protein [Myxococcales bacterium]
MTDENRFLLSVVIPAHNEEKNLAPTVTELTQALREAGIRYEILVVNDNSTDDTAGTCAALCRDDPGIRVVTRTKLGGFGRAIRGGLAVFRGDVVAIVMADRSDDPRDVVRYYRKIEEGYDCVFGSRFRSGSEVVNYPRSKLWANRIVNRGIQLLFWTRFNDLTNAFKMYRRDVVLECGPYSSSHFNLTIEMSLSALIRRYHIAEIPIRWHGRTWGASNLSIGAMGRRYLSTLLKVFFERLLIADDILEERLAERSLMADRLGSLESRVDRFEGEVRELRKGPLPPVDPGDSTG